MKEEKILSIRLSLDGLSFWTTELSSKTSEGQSSHIDLWSRTPEQFFGFSPELSLKENIEQAYAKIIGSINTQAISTEIYPDTLQYAAVPAEYMDDSLKEGYLDINSIQLTDKEALYDICLNDKVCLLHPFNREAVNTLAELTGNSYRINTLFSINDSHLTKYGIGRRNTTSVYLSSQNAYITVYEGKSGNVLYMETFNWSSAADILYYMTLLDKEFGVKKGKIYLRGTRAEEVFSVLRKYFKKIRCE